MDFLRLSETEREKEREREKRTLRASQKEDRDAFTSLSLSLFFFPKCVFVEKCRIKNSDLRKNSHQKISPRGEWIWEKEKW